MDARRIFQRRRRVAICGKRGKSEGSNMYEVRRRRCFGIGISLVCTLPFVARQCRYLHLGNVRELKRDPISQAIECGDCHLSNGWRRAFYRRTVKCANRRSVPPLHFNQIIPPLCASVALKDLTGLKGLISLLSFFSLSVLASGSLMLFSELPLSRGREMSRDVSWLDCHFALVPSLSLSLCSINRNIQERSTQLNGIGIYFTSVIFSSETFVDIMSRPRHLALFSLDLLSASYC